MELPNKLVKKTNYARINELFVPFSWSSRVRANVLSEWIPFRGVPKVPQKMECTRFLTKKIVYARIKTSFYGKEIAVGTLVRTKFRGGTA